MIKLSEIKNDAMIAVDTSELEIMDKEAFLESSYYLDREVERCPKVYTTIKKVQKFYVSDWVNYIGEDDTYEDWDENVLYDIGQENIKLIEKIMNEASSKNPTYWEDKEIDINN